MQKAIVLFDGVCNLCQSSVQFIITHDTKNHFQFASLQSEIGKKLLQQYGISNKIDTVVLIETNQAFIKSSAALKIAKQLNHYVKWLYVFIVLPAFIRNIIYDIVAKNRYQWFGKQENCWLPNDDLNGKFLG